MPNQLIHETSPYLLQHADNPVEWCPWGEAALQRARDENKPILLSIGYAACHWCHVMAHESFEDEATAELMNELFVNIKVDREERPDLDDIYMQAVVAITGQGGWPMTVFLTPEGKPFYGGTYYPKEPRFGMPAFKQVLLSVAGAWQERQTEVQRSATEITGHIQRTLDVKGVNRALDADVFTTATRTLSGRFDSTGGGFSRAPKFPQPMVLEFLLREYLRSGDQDALAMAEFTLQKMASGGMYDQIGGGFARYSTDERWLVPHFEKMLYDNAQLARVYLHTWQITGKPLYRRIVEETLDYVLREMQHKGGGFYSSQDADSEGVEGKFYVWSADEIQDSLGEHAELFMRVYGISEGGNWEGHNILHVPNDSKKTTEEEAKILREAREHLYNIRAQRVWPGLDDKILTAWNGLMLGAFAEAGRALDRADYTAAATKNASFLFNTLRREDGRLYRTWKAGSQAKYNAYLDDYAFLADGLLALYQTTFEEGWFTWVSELAEHMLGRFRDQERGGFYDTSDDHEDLIHRPKGLEDNAIPSGNAMAAQVLFKLSLYSGDENARQVAEEAVQAMLDLIRQYPFGFGEWLNTAQLIHSQSLEVALVGDGDSLDALLRVVREGYRPNIVVAAGEESDHHAVPLLAKRPMIAGKATAYVCQGFVCDRPTTNPETLKKQLERSYGLQMSNGV